MNQEASSRRVKVGFTREQRGWRASYAFDCSQGESRITGWPSSWPVLPLAGTERLVFSLHVRCFVRLFLLLSSSLFIVAACFSSLTNRTMSDREQEVSTRLAKYDDCFVDARVAEGVGSFATPLDESGSIREGLVTFAAFAASGVLPLLVYALSPLLATLGGGSDGGPVSQGTLFFWACLVTAAALFAIGIVKVCDGRRIQYMYVRMYVHNVFSVSRESVPSTK